VPVGYVSLLTGWLYRIVAHDNCDLPICARKVPGKVGAGEVFSGQDAEAFILLSMQDVTQRRAAEHKLAEVMEQKDMLLQEMQHRVANSLQLIASILLLKSRTANSEETRGQLQDAHRRVMSVASTQAHLRALRSGENVRMGPYLSELCKALASSMVSEHRAVQFKVEVEKDDASSTEAVSLGLIVTELVINALKHAFTDDTAGGVIAVSYDVDGPAWRLTVCDNGVGQPQAGSEPKTAGLGTSIIAALAKQLDGRVERSRTSPHGTTVSIVHGRVPSRLARAA
jgi:two-component sensor histidine kinase